VTILCFLLSYVAGFSIVLLITSAVDTAGGVILSIFHHLRRIVPSLVFAVAGLGTYLGVVGYRWLASITCLHVSCAMIALIVIVEYSNDSMRCRTAGALALLANDRTSEARLGATLARAETIGHVCGFAVAALAHLRGSPIF
jgi:hypothetical protein